jgi:N-acetyl sugar amidotransferase
MQSDRLVVGIDASRNRSGGAKSHLIGILTDSDPTEHGIAEVHVWSYSQLLAELPSRSWLIKHANKNLEKSLPFQLWWQARKLPIEAREARCRVLLSTDAGSVSRFAPSVTMSRNMLPFESGEIDRYSGVPLLRLLALRRLDAWSLRSASGAIFLTEYAATTIQQCIGTLGNIRIIPHGVGEQFRGVGRDQEWPAGARNVRCLYVSNTAPYKHQWHVVRAISDLRRKGYQIDLELIGGGSGEAQRRLECELTKCDPLREFVTCLDYLPSSTLPSYLAKADIFIFASSCENMPNTLIEAMAAGLPIACSSRGPMPEVLADGGVFFDPENPSSIATAVEQLLTNPGLRMRKANRAFELAKQYSWRRCGSETWKYLVETARQHDLSGKRPYRVCARCVMDTTDSRITFNGLGICDHCQTFDKHVAPNWHTDERGERRLQELVRKIKAKAKKSEFDCIIGMSGGIDSSYLTYKATELGLRPLVFHVDAGWNTQEASNNIECLVDKLGLQLYTEVINWEEMRDLQLAFFKSGVPHIDTPQDHAFFATMYKFAEAHNISYILTGANFATECIRNPIEWMYYQSDSVQIKDIHRRFGSRPLASFPLTTIIRHKLWLPYAKGIQVVRPLNYMNYNKAAAMQCLVEKFGWQPYPQKHFESRFTRFYEGYWLPTKFGFDTRKVQLSSLIVTGQITREAALEILKNPALDDITVRQEFEYVANKLEISIDELRGYLVGPNRTYRDYRSQEMFYRLGARAMKMLGLELGGKR